MKKKGKGRLLGLSSSLGADPSSLPLKMEKTVGM